MRVNANSSKRPTPPAARYTDTEKHLKYHMQVSKSYIIMNGKTAVKIQTQRVPGTHSTEVVTKHS